MSETTHCQRVLEVLVDGRWLAHHDRRERILAIASGFPLTPAQRRWLDKVEVTEDCWLWTACKSARMGYGTINVRRGWTRYAHRWAYMWFVGPIPEGREIDHLCRVAACVNPVHLEAVAHRENVRRGDVALVYGRRTHCDQGHEFTPGNTRRRADCNGRVCITCARAATARYREKNREKMREKDRLLKRALREKRGVPERWPGRIHPTLGGGAT